jgi:hypothetical protein
MRYAYIPKCLRQWLRREDGSATIEFVIMFPLIMMLFFSSLEVGIFLTRSVLLDRALDVNIRALRLGALNPATQEELKRRICNDTIIFSRCMEELTIDLRPISSTSWDMPNGRVTCVDRNAEIEPAVDFEQGGDNEIMLVRACAVMDPFFGSTPLVMDMPLDASGGYTIVAASVFVNEP